MSLRERSSCPARYRSLASRVDALPAVLRLDCSMTSQSRVWYAPRRDRHRVRRVTLMRFVAAGGGKMGSDGRLEAMTSAANGKSDSVIETIAIFSDQLRTPLTPIWAHVAMLLGGDYGPLSAEQRKALEIVQRNSARLLEVIEHAEQSLARSVENP